MFHPESVDYSEIYSAFDLSENFGVREGFFAFFVFIPEKVFKFGDEFFLIGNGFDFGLVEWSDGIAVDRVNGFENFFIVPFF